MLPADIETVGEIWLTASIQAHDFVPEEFWRSELIAKTTEILPHPDTEGFVFEQSGTIDGFITLCGTHVGCLFVRPGKQGNGIGASLLRHAKHDHAELDLTVYKQNRRATSFYKREGFLFAGESLCQFTGCEEYAMRWTRGEDL